MKVLHVSAGNMYGGIERLLGTLAAEKSLCPEMSPEFALCIRGRIGDELEASGAPVHYLGVVRARYPISIRRGRESLRRIIKERQIDILVTHAPWVHAIFGPVSRIAGIPVVIWIHAPLAGRHWLDWWAALTPARAAICNSQYTLRASLLLRTSVPRAVIYYPVRRLSNSGDAGSSKPLRLELNVSINETLIVQLGRIDAYKGHAFLLSALGRLPSSLKWQCLVVGGPHSAAEYRLEKRLHRMTAALGIADRVHFLGERQDVGRILASTDILCHPNLSPEAFGIAIVEALWEGTAIIATSLGGPKEILGSEYGLLVTPGRPQELATAILSTSSDSAGLARMKNTGPLRAKALCDPYRQLNLVASFLRDVSTTFTAAHKLRRPR